MPISALYLLSRRSFWPDASERLDLEKLSFEYVNLTIPGHLKILSISEAGVCYFFHREGVYKWEPTKSQLS